MCIMHTYDENCQSDTLLQTLFGKFMNHHCNTQSYCPYIHNLSHTGLTSVAIPVAPGCLFPFLHVVTTLLVEGQSNSPFACVTD